MISVSAVNNTEIIKITVTNKNAVTAKNIANVTANYFMKEIVKLYNMNNVNVLDEAINADNPFNINIAKQVVIYFVVGLILALGIVFVVFYFDRTIKSVPFFICLTLITSVYRVYAVFKDKLFVNFT